MEFEKVVITYKTNTDRIYSEDHEGTFEFSIGDNVIFISNGLIYLVENKKILRWMKASKNYIKINFLQGV